MYLLLTFPREILIGTVIRMIPRHLKLLNAMCIILGTLEKEYGDKMLRFWEETIF